MKRIERLASDDAGAFVSPAKRRKRGLVSRLAHAIFSLFILLALLGGLGFVVLRGGVDSDLLRREAQNSLTHILGAGASASIGNTELSLDASSYVAIEATDVSIDDPKQGVHLEHVRSVRLGLSPLGLLTGRVRIAALEVSGFSFELPVVEGAGFWKSLPYTPSGHVNMDAVAAEIFNLMRRSLELLDAQETRSIRISDGELGFMAGETHHSLTIRNLDLTDSNGKLAIAGAVEWQGKTIEVTGQADRKAKDKALHAFSLELSNIPVAIGSSPAVAPVIEGQGANPAHFSLLSKAQLSLSGSIASDSASEQIDASFALDDIDLDMGRIGQMHGSAAVNLRFVQGSDKIEILESSFQLGGLKTSFNGAFGPQPLSDNTTDQPAYRFEVLTNDAVSKPAESNDVPLQFAARIGGRFLVEQQRIEFGNLDIKTKDGELYGQGSMGFGAGSPEMIFMLRIPKMPVADAKHLWPVDVADGARSWVLKNLFGGYLYDSRIDISLPGGRFNGPGLPAPLTGEEIKADFRIADTRFDVIGDLPAVRDADGEVSVRGAYTTIRLDKGIAYTANNRQVNVGAGTLIIPWGAQRPVIASLDLGLSGDAAAIMELAGYKPIDIRNSVPFSPSDISGEVNGHVKVAFSVTRNPPPGTLKWSADFAFKDVDIGKPVGGSLVADASGTIKVDQSAAFIAADAKLDGIPARVTITEPINLSGAVKRDQKVTLSLDNKARDIMLPGTDTIFSGLVTVDIGMAQGGKRPVSVDLTKAGIDLVWLGWRKGVGVPARASFDLIQSVGENGQPDKRRIEISNLVLTADTFGARGNIVIANGDLQKADFTDVRLNRNDNLRVTVGRNGNGYRVNVLGSRFDARALIRQATELGEKSNGRKSDAPRIVVSAHIDEVDGFNGEALRNVNLSYESSGNKISGFSVNAQTMSGKAFVVTNNEQGNARSISLQSDDAGSVLRFFDFYDKMHGGKITVGLAAQGDRPLTGQIDARNFSIINEPRLASLVSSAPAGGKSLNQAVKRNIDVSRVDVERGFSLIEKGKGYLNLSKGVVRSPTIGTTFQGTLYDQKGNMSITGTFMPAYGLNRIFGDIPIVGALLGNGRDGGLIGITYKLTGNAKHPHVTVNPISIIAPGIFRSIFEF
ncbi:RNA-binding protein [Daeguia caeni]|uniref:RNA-binding protein n=1 Tax=Daeguia caeni TaxID=439612 RepID=A0ABV9H9Q5_9HYPH